MVAFLPSFTARFKLVFVLTLESTFSKRFHFKVNRKAQVLLKTGTRHPFKRSACFHVTISENFKSFLYFNFETDFLEKQILSIKMEYRFLFASTKNENALFPYKSTISETNATTNRMVTTKLTNHKDQRFASN